MAEGGTRNPPRNRKGGSGHSSPKGCARGRSIPTTARWADGGLIKDVKYRDLENSKCSDLVDGIIYINSSHSLNREVFGGTQKDYFELIKGDRTAQYRLSTILVEQSVFRLAEDWYLKNKLLLVPHAPVTSMREFVDEKTNELAPKLLKVLVG